MPMLWPSIVLGTCLIVLIYSAWLWWENSASRAARRIEQRLQRAQTLNTAQTHEASLHEAITGLRPDDSKLDAWLGPWLHQAGLTQRRSRHYLLLHGYMVTVASLALALAHGVDAWWALAMLLMVCAPPWAVYLLAERHRRQVEAQLPHLIDDMVTALQAGHTLHNLWPGLAKRTPHPLRRHVHAIEQRLDFGESLDLALQAWIQNTSSADLRFFITALRIQHQSGGNPLDLLRAQAALIREKLDMQRSIQASTSEARLSAWILAMMPVLAALALAVLSPDRFALLWTDAQGQWMLRLAVFFELTGVLWLWWLLRARI